MLKERVSIIIPSLNPDEKLMQVVSSLIDDGYTDIVIVNDGSDEDHMEPFKMADKHKECTVLTHEVNKGKGRALKTAFEYLKDNRDENLLGVVTVDGDNQHKVEDITRCLEAMSSNPDTVILGCRDFSGDDVPPRSKFGNNVTRVVFKFACGLNISDTQTGLRAIPYIYLEDFSKVTGERFEYETNMLLELKEKNIPYYEVKIKTVYIEENATSHFNPLKDSLKIYKVIFGFILSSLSSSVLDLLAFALILAFTKGRVEDRISILISTVGARTISSFYNYTMNRMAVFKASNSKRQSIFRYYTLCVCQMFVSYGLVYFVTYILRLDNGALTVVMKAIIDTILFIISFQIQRRWVFKR